MRISPRLGISGAVPGVMVAITPEAWAWSQRTLSTAPAPKPSEFAGLGVVEDIRGDGSGGCDVTCVYELQAVAVCPVDKAGDLYWVTVTAERELRVEDILEAVKQAGGTPKTQEAFTDEVHRALAAMTQTVGYHSGVKTTVTC